MEAMSAKRRWPAPERNKEPILAVLREVMTTKGLVLELASGTGQHAVFFAEALPHLEWQPTDLDAENLASLEAYVADAALPNLRRPLRLDVLERPWPVENATYVFAANLVHIAPWSVSEALFAGAGEVLVPGGALVTYGAYRIGGEHTSESNRAFDADLRARDPSWGVRDLEALEALAEQNGMELERRLAMPSNNFTLVFRRRTPG